MIRLPAVARAIRAVALRLTCRLCRLPHISHGDQRQEPLAQLTARRASTRDGASDTPRPTEHVRAHGPVGPMREWVYRQRKRLIGRTADQHSSLPAGLCTGRCTMKTPPIARATRGFE